jgi:hypothetical protein
MRMGVNLGGESIGRENTENYLIRMGKRICISASFSGLFADYQHQIFRQLPSLSKKSLPIPLPNNRFPDQ